MADHVTETDRVLALLAELARALPPISIELTATEHMIQANRRERALQAIGDFILRAGAALSAREGGEANRYAELTKALGFPVGQSHAGNLAVARQMVESGATKGPLPEGAVAWLDKGKGEAELSFHKKTASNRANKKSLAAWWDKVPTGYHALFLHPAQPAIQQAPEYIGGAMNPCKCGDYSLRMTAVCGTCGADRCDEHHASQQAHPTGDKVRVELAAEEIRLAIFQSVDKCSDEECPDCRRLVRASRRLTAALDQEKNDGTR